jgi:fido (protein-threonine AMPylation protein)
MTIMKGSRGYHNLLSFRDLKVIGSRNFIELYKEIFSNLHTFTDIGIDLLKRIHFVLSRGIDANAGNFRTYDFSDKNGVTLDYGNFQREIGDLGHVLWETAQSFHDLEAFIHHLSRSYYMFIGIHPFGDSNSRTGRCLNFLLLKKACWSASSMRRRYSPARYGGSMEDMHEYIKTRIMKAVDLYFYERWKLEQFGLISKNIHNVSFDSGFHFGRSMAYPEA